MKKLFLFFLCIGFLNTIAFSDNLPALPQPEKPDLSVTKEILATKNFSTNSIDPVLEEKPFKLSMNNFEDDISNEDVPEIVKKAASVFDKLEETGRWVSALTGNHLVELPVGIKKNIFNVSYLVAVSKARITPEYTEINVFLKITIPQKKNSLFFGASNVKISHEGGIIGDAKLVLLDTVRIPIGAQGAELILKGDINTQTGDFDNLTYATIDCEGFKELGITADVIFPRNMIVPVDENGDVREKGKVKASFSTIVTNWNDILVELNLPSFAMATYKGISFNIEKAVFDFSDIRNSNNVNFPTGYKEQYLLEGNYELWRGVYIETVEVFLPKEFNLRNNPNKRIIVGAKHLLIDGIGVSGGFFAYNVLPLKEGVAGKWALSLDTIRAKLRANHLVEGKITGDILLPATKNDDCALAYKGFFNTIEKEYLINVKAKENIGFDVFSAKCKIYRNSFVELKVKDKKFMPKACLTGHMNLAVNIKPTKKSSLMCNNDTTSFEKRTVYFKQIAFQELTLQTISPKITVKYLGYNGEAKVGNFPVSISNIELITEQQRAGLGFNLTVNLTKDEEKLHINAEGDLTVWGELNEKEGLESWQYNNLELNAFCIDANLGLLIKGCITAFEDDPVYGKGFSGNVTVLLPGMKSNIEGTILFGKADDYRYFYVDMFSMLPSPGIPLVGAFGINGFGGGLYHHMTMARMEVLKTETIGRTKSGIVYKPHKNTFLGLRAIVGVGLTLNWQILNGSAGFNIEFNRHAGINKMGFTGEVEILATGQLFEKLGGVLGGLKKMLESVDIDIGLSEVSAAELQEKSGFEQEKTGDVSEENTAVIKAGMYIMHDFENGVLHGEMEVYINVAGIITGIGPNYRACRSVIHFEEGYWYYYIGTPSDPMGLKIGVGNIRVTAKSYFMAGHELEPSPPPPAKVAQILGVDAEVLDYMRDENKIKGAKGLAFGASFEMSTGEITFLFLYGRFDAGIGFDIMLRDYGEAQCKGDDGPIGINGWYANGQAYAYLDAAIGIKIRIFGKKKKFPIIEAGMATLLQAKLPNPLWMRGYLGGHYRILGGLIKGRFRFKLEIGEECEFVNTAPLDGMPVIADISPQENATEIDVFEAPQVVFNYSISTPFLFDDDEGRKEYKIELEHYKLLNDGQEIVGEMDWNSNNDAVTFYSHDILPPNAEINLKVAVSFMEKVQGIWKAFTNENGQKIIENRDFVFTTGEAPDYIPLSNISYLYPVIDQQHYYPEESTQGHVKLKRGQPYLFDTSTGWTQSIVYTSDNENKTTDNISYSGDEKLVSFNLPRLQNETQYGFTMLNSPSGSDTQIDDAVNSRSYSTTEYEGGTTVERRQNEATSVKNTASAEIIMLEYQFKSSMYKTFSDKIEKLRISIPILEMLYSDVDALLARMDDFKEVFEPYELTGGDYTNGQPLITTYAILDDNYYKEEIFPLIYKNYPLEDIRLTRDENLYGVPPVHAVEPLSWYKTYTENNIEKQLTTTYYPFRYNLPMRYKQDFIDLQYKVVNKYLTSKDAAKYASYIQGVFPPISKGSYKTRVQYVLPGGKKGTSAVFKFKNPVK